MPSFSYHAVIDDDAGSGIVFQEHTFRSDYDIRPGDVIEGEDGHPWYVHRVEEKGVTSSAQDDPASTIVARTLVCRVVDEPPAEQRRFYDQRERG